MALTRVKKVPTANLVQGSSFLTTASTLTSSNMPAGSVLQVVYNSSGTNVALANDVTTFGDAVAASITPSATSSKIMVLCSCAGDANNGNYRAIRYRIARAISGGSTTTIIERNYHMYDSNAQSHNIDNTELSFLDSPNTTSALTYTLQGSHQTGSAVSGTYNGYLNRYNLSSFVLIEIAG